MIETTRRFFSALLKVIQASSFTILLGIYISIAVLQGYKLLLFKTEGMTFTFLVSGTIFTIVIFYLALEAYKKSPAEKQLRFSVIGNGVGALGACLGIILFYRACMHEESPLWTNVDTRVILKIIIGACIIFLYAVRKGLKFKDPIIVGLLIGLLMGANQFGVADAISRHGREGIFLGTIVAGYLLPCVRLVMLIPSPQLQVEAGGKLPSRREKLGIVVAESANIISWSYVTYQFIQHG